MNTDIKIEVAIRKGKAQNDKGILLENLAKEFMQSRNYEVIDRINFTGSEVDLLCKFKANPNKIICIECKAYNENNPIQADVISKLLGNKDARNYEESWLISTSRLGKEAKGLVEELSGRKDLVFYTPEKLIDALIDTNLIVSPDVVRNNFKKIISDEHKIGELSLLIAEEGRFWMFKPLDGSSQEGVAVFYAKDGEIVKDCQLLNNLSKLKSSLNGLNFLEFSEKGKMDDAVSSKETSFQDIRITKKHLENINDIKIKILRFNKGDLSLEDIFIYPDLEFLESEENLAKSINSTKLEEIGKEYSRCLIFGDYFSGKTSLALKLQEKTNLKGFISLYIKAEEIKKYDFEKFSKILVKKFEEQYGSIAEHVYFFRQRLALNDPNILLIVDDIDLLNIKNPERKKDFFRMLSDKFTNIFMFAHKSSEVEFVSGRAGLEMFLCFQKFRIKPLGHALQGELIEKWISAERGEAAPEESLMRDILRKISIAVGVKFIPTYPLYLLTILQLIERGGESSLQGSPYAELYRCMIDQALRNANANPEDLDFLHTYLSHFAYQLFVSRKKYLSREGMSEMYGGYQRKMYVGHKFDQVHRLLTEAKIVQYDGDSYSFNHSYSYFFFVAKYLSDNKDDSEVKHSIGEMVENLHCGENANIIIFLIHHSKDKEIIDKILDKAGKIFDGISPSELSGEEFEDINKTIRSELNFSIEDGDPSEYRKEELEMKDRVEEAEKMIVDEDVIGTELDLLGQIKLAFKIIEILGQIATCYYGSLNGETKMRILESASSLGLRAHRAWANDFRQYLPAIKKDIADYFENHKDELRASIKKESMADRIIFSFVAIITFYVIKLIGDGMASKNIFEVIDRMIEEKSTTAYRLIGISAKLNFERGYKENEISDLNKSVSENHLAKTMLKLLVAEYLYKFYVPISEKQSICARLNIKLLPAGGGLLEK